MSIRLRRVKAVQVHETVSGTKVEKGQDCSCLSNSIKDKG